MKVFNLNSTAGAKYAPAFLLLSYYILVGLDLLTTYLASPDLKYEGNYFIRKLELGWLEILLLVTSFLIIITLGLAYINRNYRRIDNGIKFIKISKIKIFWSKKLLINFFILGLFYIHFTYSIFIVTNNYLSYIFLSKVNNIFTPIANWYINNIILKYVNFLNYSLLFFILLGFYIAFISVRNILRYNLCLLTPKIT